MLALLYACFIAEFRAGHQKPVGLGASKEKIGLSEDSFCRIFRPTARLWVKKTVKNGPLRSICSRRFPSPTGSQNFRMSKPITDPFVPHACELLSCLGPGQAKRMFGGFGLSVDGMNLGLTAWNTLYLKTNADTEPRWLAAGCEPFVYQAKGKPMKLNYHTQPAEALESPALMPPWARLAMVAALAARKPPAARRTARVGAAAVKPTRKPAHTKPSPRR
jgi:DNA transformation protein